VEVIVAENLAEIQRELGELPVAQRAKLALALVESLEGEDQGDVAEACRGRAPLRAAQAWRSSSHSGRRSLRSNPQSRMSSEFDNLEKLALALSRGEKAALALVLIDELDPVKEPANEELWLEEARRRYDAYRRGEMKAVPGDEAMGRARSRLR